MNIQQYLAVAGALAVAVISVGCDKGSGQGQRTAGHIESGVGSLTGDKHLQHEGKKDEVIGGVKSAVGDIKGSVKDATH